MVDKYIYMILSVLAFLWVAVHYNMYNSGLPLTDDQGVPLYHR
jgi:hypothetical protein